MIKEYWVCRTKALLLTLEVKGSINMSLAIEAQAENPPSPSCCIGSNRTELKHKVSPNHQHRTTMPLKNSLSVIDKDAGSPCLSFGSDTDSVVTLQEQEMFPLTPPLHAQNLASEPTNAEPEATEKVLALTDDVLAVAKKLYSIVADKYTDDDLLDMPQVGIAGQRKFHGGACRTENSKVSLATKQLKNLQMRQKIANSQAILAENRLRVAEAQVQLLEERVTWAKEQLKSAIEG